MPTFIELASRPATQFSFDGLAEVMNRAYAGYVVPVQFDGAMLARRVVVEHMDAGCSHVFVDADGVPRGLMMISRRDDICRIAAIGFEESVRGQGHGKRAVTQALAEAKARGDRRMVLEVITSNLPAVRAYEKCGFVVVRELAGFETVVKGQAVASTDYVTGVPGLALPVLAAALPADIEWQIALPSLATSIAPTRTYMRADGQAAALFATTDAGNRLMSVGVVPGSQGKGLGRELMQALTHEFPGKWQVPAVAPAGLAPFFTACSWVRGELGQFEMVCELGE